LREASRGGRERPRKKKDRVGGHVRGTGGNCNTGEIGGGIRRTKRRRKLGEEVKAKTSTSFMRNDGRKRTQRPTVMGVRGG